jgi:hypothetical protein
MVRKTSPRHLTPFASGLVADILGHFEFNKVSQQILCGEFDIDSISNNIQLHSIIKVASHSDPANPIKAYSTVFCISRKGPHLTPKDYIMVNGRH